jgi:hypothetical protein
MHEIFAAESQEKLKQSIMYTFWPFEEICLLSNGDHLEWIANQSVLICLLKTTSMNSSCYLGLALLPIIILCQ